MEYGVLKDPLTGHWRYMQLLNKHYFYPLDEKNLPMWIVDDSFRLEYSYEMIDFLMTLDSTILWELSNNLVDGEELPEMKESTMEEMYQISSWPWR